MKFESKKETDVALWVMLADATNENAGIMGTCVDVGVQSIGQPNPAITHCELWMADKNEGDMNHFSTYLGAKGADGKLCGAQWTDNMGSSERFYRNKSWAAIPIYAVDAERRLRNECDMHVATPYPTAWTLYDYPWSVWPFRAMSGLFKSDTTHAPAHCATLSARILRKAFPEIVLRHDSHWYGPSSLYLELATPHQMERSLQLQRQTVRSQVEQEEEDELLDGLLTSSNDELAEMDEDDARAAVSTAAVKVLETGSGDDVDQTDFLEAQKRYAKAMYIYTWKVKKGRRDREKAKQTSASTGAAYGDDENSDTGTEEEAVVLNARMKA
tara:strand:- start:243 stop:1226 length:984 start_codon:yes stop_codon:yes gene_type:complete